MLRKALQYANSGFPVIPLCWPDYNGNCACGRNHQDKAIGKVPLVEHGLKDSTLTTLGVKEYWTRWPKANIGVVIPEGYFVVDVDVEHNGFDSIGKLQRQIGELPETLLITTGGGGAHYWYKTPKPIKNTTRLAGLEGLDIRGLGGYVVAPPSLHCSGNRYEISPIWQGPIIEAPQALIELCLKRQPVESNASSDNPISEGARNDTLTRDAGAMRRRGLSQDAILAALLVENRERCQPPLPEYEVRRIAGSVGRYQPEVTHSKSSHGYKGGVVL
ncbi:bifunctional DNA primase/polymerase [Chloroflexota bacterium]